MSSPTTQAPYYYVPDPSKHPIRASIGLLGFGVGMSQWVNGHEWGAYLTAAGVLWLLFVLYQWFGEAIHESESGLNSVNVDVSYRWSMSWFIFSEIMFFGAFFSALFYARNIAMPWLGDIDHHLIWPNFAANWPNAGPGGLIEPFRTMGPWPIPTINTAILLTSGLTVTWAHHALRENHRKQAIIGLATTVGLGFLFVILQAFEYHEAYTEMNLTLSSGIYGSTFFLLTGFHGFHVTLGAIMLSVILRRLIKGHFTPDNHFGFEGAAWYWHFVDVVWLGLYLLVYWM